MLGSVGGALKVGGWHLAASGCLLAATDTGHAKDGQAAASKPGLSMIPHRARWYSHIRISHTDQISGPADAGAQSKLPW